MKYPFIISEKAGDTEISYDVKGTVLCGYTGRDQEAVKRHIEELKKEGVEPPPAVPMFFPKPPSGLTLDGGIYVEGRETSGEVEYVVLYNEGHLYIGVGSDHTDRELERLNILKSKQVCPAVISKNLWKYEEVKAHWDRIEIRSWVVSRGEKLLYQESTLGTILPPEDLVELVDQRVDGSIQGIAILSGTPPILTENMIFSDRFSGELLDPVLDRRIEFAYTVESIDWFT
jgi:hypothetical protein